MSGPLEKLPKVTAYMDEPDERAEPLLRAMGRLVWGAASLEKVLLQVIASLRAERDGQFPSSKELSRLESASAGQLLEVLKTLDLPDDLAARIAGTIDRRNAIIHRPIEDPEVVQAVVKGENVDAVVTRVEQVALDCGQIAVELQAVTGPRLENMLGTTRDELVGLLASIDLESVADARSRQQLEAIRALGGTDLTLPWETETDSGLLPES